MFSFFYLVFILSIEIINAQLCGLRPLANNNQKIVNGIKAIPGDWAWSVSLTKDGRHFCGGVLIGDEWILSAGHCFRSVDQVLLASLAVDIGIHNRKFKDPWTIISSVSKVIVHENFIDQVFNNDIALIKLEKPIKLDLKYFIPACLPDDESMNFNSQEKEVWLTGWGHTFYGGSLTNEKMQVSMEIMNDMRCKQKYSQMFNIEKQICAGETNGNSGACQGDSGGPLMRQMENGLWYLLGLISWGYDCGQGTVFTRVSYYMPWIKETISKN